MAKKNKALSELENMINLVKPFVPESVVLKSKIYTDIKARERTAYNIWDKIKREFITSNPRYSSFDFTEVSEHIIDIIHIRTLVE